MKPKSPPPPDCPFVARIAAGSRSLGGHITWEPATEGRARGADGEKADVSNPAAHRGEASRSATQHRDAHHVQRDRQTRVQDLRKRYGDDFRQKHGVRLGIMSFFMKASAAALGEMPR